MTTLAAASPLRYPATPENIDQKILEPSPAFRAEVKKVLASIVLFMITYVVLVAAAVILAIACAWGGIMVISAFPRLITIIFGIGLLGLGGMVLFFLFKFMFKTNTVELAHLIEVTEKDHPMLFEFIRTLAKETQTPLPKRVYLSSDVNASVFYDSSFWSMFVPVRKNLQIGLGLVNAVNMSEFKAIIAHEFGHFSQRSMKLGSYVYNVNHVIYNMLYDNDGYSETLSSWGNAHWIFQLFASITVGIVRAIQWILQGLYGVINKQYMALSRQMEFHADTVAASVSGSSPLITSLRRLDVANICFDTVLNYYNRWFKENKKGENLYPAHTEVMMHFAMMHGLPVDQGIVQVTADSFAQYNKSRVMIKDQWASHPSTDDREIHLRNLNVSSSIQTDSAWTLFSEPEALQQKITAHLYSQLTFNTTPEIVDLNSFRSVYLNEAERYELDKRYKGFYDGRNVSIIDLDAVIKEESRFNSLDEVLTSDTLSLPQQITGLQNDIQLLENIQHKKSGIKVFEFDGKKYSKLEAGTLTEQLKKELEETNVALQNADKELFLFFYTQARRQGKEQVVVDDYHKMFDTNKATESAIKELEDILHPLQEIYQPTITGQAAEIITHNLKREEPTLKIKMKAILEDGRFSSCYSKEDQKSIEAYLQRSDEYFSKYSGFNNEALAAFNEAVNTYAGILTDRQFEVKKQLLAEQLSFV